MVRESGAEDILVGISPVPGPTSSKMRTQITVPLGITAFLGTTTIPSRT
jgi:hypothetical protein